MFAKLLWVQGEAEGTDDFLCMECYLWEIMARPMDD